MFSLHGDHCHRKARNAYEPLALVADLDLPDLAAIATMQGSRSRRDLPGVNRAQMIGVDFLPQTQFALGVDT
jgi:hypothetical protein